MPHNPREKHENPREKSGKSLEKTDRFALFKPVSRRCLTGENSGASFMHSPGLMLRMIARILAAIRRTA